MATLNEFLDKALVSEKGGDSLPSTKKAAENIKSNSDDLIKAISGGNAMHVKRYIGMIEKELDKIKSIL